MGTGCNFDRAYAWSSEAGDTYAQVAKLTDTDDIDNPSIWDRFGRSVAIEGDTVVVGAPHHAIRTGAVFVFRTSDGGATYPRVAKLAASDGNYVDYLGCSVAIAGATIVVGAYAKDYDGNTNRGAVYVFRTTKNGNYGQVAQLTAADTGQSTVGLNGFDDHFGESVAFDGGTVLIGARNDEDDHDGEISVPDQENSGSVYVFREEGSGGAAGAATASVGLIVGLVVAAAVLVVAGRLALNRFRSQSRASEQAAAADAEDIKLEAAFSDAADEMAAAEPSTGQKQAAP